MTTAAKPEPAARVPAQTASTPERRQLTIMFCDMVGSSALSTRLDPEEQRDVVSAFQSCCANEVKRFGGMVAQYLGDGVLAYFGYPAAHEDDAERAVRAGLSILHMVGMLKHASSVTLQARIGIASGVVVVGDLVREGVTQENAAIGETTNLAARLQSLAEPNTIIISPETHRLVGSLFEYRDLGQVSVKGFADGVRARQVLGASMVESRFDARHLSGASPLLGREEELDLLLRRWEQVKRGEGRAVLLTGEAGIGKSRLARALQERLAAEPHTRPIYHCSPYHQDSALYPVIGELQRAAAIHREDGADTKLDKLETLLTQSSENLAEDMPLFAALLSIPGGDRYRLPNLTPQRWKERTLSALLAHLKRLAARQPVLMVFEDLHWVDPTTLELLSLAIDQIKGARILVLVTARPEFTPPWPTHRHVSSISLSRLDKAEGQALVTGVTGGKSLPLEVLDQIVARTDGVPLFIEELTKTVLESGLLREVDDHYELRGPLAPLAIPSTLHASLLARLDRLASVKDVAQIGATIGREFSYSLIAAVAVLSEKDLKAALAQLVGAELIFQRGVPPDATYQFKHALVQDAAYASLVRTRRTALHATIVNELVARRSGGEAVRPEVLGHHCAEAGMFEDAARHFLEAGEQSGARAALAEALVLFDKALRQIAQLPEGVQRDRKEIEGLCARGAVLITLKGLAAFEIVQAYSQAGSLWDRLGRPPEFLRVPWGQWMYHINRSELSDARVHAETLREFGRKHGNDNASFLGHFCVGMIHLMKGELISARPQLQSALDLFQPTTHKQLILQTGFDPFTATLFFLGLESCWLGYPDQAIAYATEAIRQARQFDHPPTLGQALAGSARVASMLNDETTLASWVGELRMLAKEHGFPHWWSQVLIFEGQLEFLRSNAGEAIVHLRQGHEAYRATGATLWNTYHAILLSEALERDGNLLEALSVLEGDISADGVGAELHRRRGQLLLERDCKAAEGEFRRAINVAQGQSAKLWELRAATSLARLWREQGRVVEARGLLEPVYGWFTEGFDSVHLRDAKALLNQLNV